MLSLFGVSQLPGDSISEKISGFKGFIGTRTYQRPSARSCGRAPAKVKRQLWRFHDSSVTLVPTGGKLGGKRYNQGLKGRDMWFIERLYCTQYSLNGETRRCQDPPYQSGRSIAPISDPKLSRYPQVVSKFICLWTVKYSCLEGFHRISLKMLIALLFEPLHWQYT